MAVKFVENCFFVTGLVAYLSFPVSAQIPRSEDYTLDYAIVGSATAATVSNNEIYEITGLVTTEGVAGGTAATANSSYTITPLVGENLPANASVKYWSLY